jgi:hypothetical protein
LGWDFNEDAPSSFRLPPTEDVNWRLKMWNGSVSLSMCCSLTVVSNGLLIIGLHPLLLPCIGALFAIAIIGLLVGSTASKQWVHGGDGGGRARWEVADLGSETVEEGAMSLEGVGRAAARLDARWS